MNYWTKKFVELNKKYWNGQLSIINVNVVDLTKENADGMYYYPHEDNPARIELDRNIAHHHKVNALLHEMCHHAVNELYDYTPYHFHGKEWKREMVRCGFKGKIHARRGLLKIKNL